MQESDRAEFATLLADVMAYYRQEASAFLLDVFWTGLANHAFADVRRAFTLHARDPDRGQYAPRVADITRLLEGSTQTQGMRAWSKVERAMRSVGAYRTVAFDDPLVHVAISEMGGWASLCRTTAEELPFKAREFEKIYASYRHQRELPAFPPVLIGENEAENRLAGRHEQYQVRPVLIGEPRRAAAVIEQGRAEANLQITAAGDMAMKTLARITSQGREDAA